METGTFKTPALPRKRSSPSQEVQVDSPPLSVQELMDSVKVFFGSEVFRHPFNDPIDANCLVFGTCETRHFPLSLSLSFSPSTRPRRNVSHSPS